MNKQKTSPHDGYILKGNSTQFSQSDLSNQMPCGFSELSALQYNTLFTQYSLSA